MKRLPFLHPHQTLLRVGSEAVCQADLQSCTLEGRKKVESRLKARGEVSLLPPWAPCRLFLLISITGGLSSPEKHCVMCSFLAFIKETQCSAVTLPSLPGNLPTPRGPFIGSSELLGFSPARISNHLRLPLPSPNLQPFQTRGHFLCPLKGTPLPLRL